MTESGPVTVTVTPVVDYEHLSQLVAERLSTLVDRPRWMATKKAQTYTDLGPKSFKRFVKDHGIPVHREGQYNFYDRAELDRGMTEDSYKL